jgi:hypothetical protein
MECREGGFRRGSVLKWVSDGDVITIQFKIGYEYNC